MKILYITNIPSPYKVDFFNELGKYVDLTVLFELESSTERDDEWKKYRFETFQGIIMKGKRMNVDTAFCPGVTRYLKKGVYDFIVLSVLASPTVIMAATILRCRKIPYFYEGDGGFVGKTTGLKALVKRFVLGGACKWLSPAKEFDTYCLTYGAKSEGICRYSFTSVKAEDMKRVLPTTAEKRRLRQEFGIAEECAIVSVGQFIHRKGMDLLLECSRYLPEDVGVYIVGGKASEEYLALQEKYGLKNVHFLEFMPKKRVVEFFGAMDIFALFTREDIWGLVVNEAMAAGLPVVGTTRCNAALELIEHGKNGFLVETENVEQMKNALLELVRSKELREEMGGRALQTVANYTIENMALEHKQIFETEGKKV